MNKIQLFKDKFIEKLMLMKEKLIEKLISMKKKLIPKLPLIFLSVIGLISLIYTIEGITNYLFLMSGQFLPFIPTFILFGDPTQPNFIVFVGMTAFVILGWLFSTKYKKFQSKRWRLVWFWNMFVGVLSQFLWLITAPVYNFLLPYIIGRAERMDEANIWLSIAIGDLDSTLVVFMFVPTVVIAVLLFWLSGQYNQYSQEINEAFNEFEFKNSLLQKWFKIADEDASKVSWPDVVLGPESETKELIIQPGRDRTLNNVIIGSIGTGKTSAVALPIINQDLHWMTRFINDYPKTYNREDFHTEDVKGRYLNGISIIEPSNDLCQKAYQLVMAHGIPKESVFYIDPTNKDTPSINPMMGPVEKVAEAFAMVMEGLAEGGNDNFFFQQAERNHLKNYIYLLKLHDPDKQATFDMLLQMYDNPNLVHEMHWALKKSIPEDFEGIQDRDERNHWLIVKQIDEWFDVSIAVKTQGHGNVPVLVPHGKYRGQEMYEDTKAQFVQGLRNVLNDIGASPLIRRVLFGESSFDFDRHLEAGGVLLVNTAKGELSSLSNILGKFVLLSLQNAVFRRKPNVSTFHHIIVDEAPDYLYRPFKEFPAQSRKYKTIITIIAQTVAQLADKYGETYMHTLLGTLRHKLVYGDVTSYDAKLFSEIFGEIERFEESVNEQAVSPLQENPVLRKGNTFSKKKEAILGASDIIYQEAFQAAVKIVVNNKPMPVKQIDANFVPKEEFSEAIIKVEEDSAALWLEERMKISSEMNSLVKEIEEDGSEENDKSYSQETMENEITESVDETLDEKIQIENELTEEISSIPPTLYYEYETSTVQKGKRDIVSTRSPYNSTEVVKTVSLDEYFGIKKQPNVVEETKNAEIGEEQEELLSDMRKVLEDEEEDRPSSQSSVNSFFTVYEKK